VVISEREYHDLTTPAVSFVDFLRQSPLVGAKLDLSRDRSSDREIDL
jgi:hypothetical protein